MDNLNVYNNTKVELIDDRYIEITDEDILNLIIFFPEMLNNKFILERIRYIKEPIILK